MLFNMDKCKIMHIGYNNGTAKYEMNGKYLEEVIEERDLGVIIQSDLKCSSQCIKAVNTANRILGMIKRTFCVRDKDIILQLYKSLVRPHLEYSVQAWRPHFQKDIDLIEGVQTEADYPLGRQGDRLGPGRLGWPGNYVHRPRPTGVSSRGAQLTDLA